MFSLSKMNVGHILEMGLTSEPSRKKRENGRGTGPSHLEHSFDEQVRLDQSFIEVNDERHAELDGIESHPCHVSSNVRDIFKC